MASIAFHMESNLLADARDHDELLCDDAFEAATKNEESDVSEFSSNDDADDGDAEKVDATADVAVLDCVPMMTPNRMVMMVMLRSLIMPMLLAMNPLLPYTGDKMRGVPAWLISWIIYLLEFI